MSGTKKILVGVGATTILLLLSVWIYLFIYGTPDNVREITADLGFDNEPTEFTPIETTSEETTLSLSSKTIAQLTTRAVAGFGIDNSGKGESPTIRYAERGTGHIYEIDISKGLESRVSGSTVGQTVEAYFNDTLDLVVLVSEVGDTTKAGLYTLNTEGTTKIEDLPVRSGGFDFDAENNLDYVAISTNGTTAYQYDTSNGKTSTLWSTPLRDINVYWNNGNAIVVNRIAPRLKSGIYGVRGGTLYQLVTPSYDLSATVGNNGRQILYSFFNPNESQRESYVLDLDSGQTTMSALIGTPEKCTYVVEDGFWCASSEELEYGREATTAWYRGEFISSDTLWKESQNEESAEYVAFLKEEVGFDIDVTDIQSSADGQWLFFRNKTNDAIWMYRINEPPPNLEELQTEEETTDASVEQTPEQ